MRRRVATHFCFDKQAAGQGEAGTDATACWWSQDGTDAEVPIGEVWTIGNLGDQGGQNAGARWNHARPRFDAEPGHIGWSFEACFPTRNACIARIGSDEREGHLLGRTVFDLERNPSLGEINADTERNRAYQGQCWGQRHATRRYRVIQRQHHPG